MKQYEIERTIGIGTTAGSLIQGRVAVFRASAAAAYIGIGAELA